MTNNSANTPARRLDDHLPSHPLQWEGQSDAARQEHAKIGASLANAMADAAAAYLAHMGTGGGIAAIPHTGPAQYVVAGTMEAISKVLGEQMPSSGDLTDERISELHDSMFPAVAFDRDKIMGNVVRFTRAAIAAALASQSQAAQPTELTPERIYALWKERGGDGAPAALRFARAIESEVAAHIAGTSQATKVQAEPVINGVDEGAFQHAWEYVVDASDPIQAVWLRRFVAAYIDATESTTLAQQYSDMLRKICFEYSAGGYNSEGLMSHEAANAKIRWIIDDTRRAAELALAAPVAKEAPAVLEGLSNAALGFIDSVIEVAFEAGDLDGGTIQEWAEKAGLLEAKTMTEPCSEGQNCRCADGNDFPLTCYQKTYRAKINEASVSSVAKETPLHNVRPGVPTASQVQAEEAELYRTLTGDAMALGFDSITAALGALRKVKEAPAVPELTVWYGSMPESNGKSNFTAILTRKDAKGLDVFGGFTIARSEYPDRVRYEADCVRYLIGELAERPDILDYDADKHSGYVKPVASVAVDATREAADLRTFLLNHITSHEIEGRTLERLTLAHNEVHLLREMLGGSATREAETGVQEVTPQAERPDGCWGISADTSLKTVTLRFDTSDQVLAYYGAVNAHNTAATTSTSRREAIAGAVARGWCTPENASKVLDNDLALAIVAEVEAELASRGRAQGGNTDTESGSDIATTTSTVSAPTEQAELTPLDYRAQGREEALAIILAQNPEEPFADHTHSYQIGDTGDYGTEWDEGALRELLSIGDRKHDAYDRAEAAYWESLGHKEEAERMKRTVERAPFFKPLNDFLAEKQQWGLLYLLQEDAAPSSTEGAQKAPEDVRNQAAGKQPVRVLGPGNDVVSAAAYDVLAERRRQVEVEGWTPEHDDEHGACSMSYAAACYALADTPAARITVNIEKLWEWTGWSWFAWWKPKDRRCNLVRAGALILADIERIDRAALRTSSTDQANADTGSAA